MNGGGILEILTGRTETHNTCLAVMVNGRSAVTSLLLVQLTALSIQAPSLSPLCVCVCVFSRFQLPSLTHLLMERRHTHTHTQGRHVHTRTHRHTITHAHTHNNDPHSLGALICLNEYPAPLYRSLLWFISGETWRHPLCPSSCPLHYEGTLASQWHPPPNSHHPSASQHDIITHISHSAPQRQCCSLEKQ